MLLIRAGSVNLRENKIVGPQDKMSKKKVLTKPSCEDVEERWQRNKCEKGEMKGELAQLGDRQDAIGVQSPMALRRDHWFFKLIQIEYKYFI